jgi:hypothetical protein
MEELTCGGSQFGEKRNDLVVDQLFQWDTQVIGFDMKSVFSFGNKISDIFLCGIDDQGSNAAEIIALLSHFLNHAALSRERTREVCT